MYRVSLLISYVDLVIKKNQDPKSSLYSFFLVLRPRAIQIGQKLNKLVATKIAASARRIIASVPEITWVEYKTTTMTATSILITLSIIPTFFFIFFN
jgi:hypothetical protein